MSELGDIAFRAEMGAEKLRKKYPELAEAVSFLASKARSEDLREEIRKDIEQVHRIINARAARLRA